MKRLLFVLAALCAAGRAPQAAPAPGVIAIEGATVHVGPGKKLDNATIVVRDGKIAAVGAGVTVPAGATRIDARGAVVTAGLIDPYTTIGLVEVGLEPDANDGALEGDEDQVHAAYRVVDGYNVSSVAIPVARTGGVTSVVAVPRGGLVAGASAWTTLRDAGTVTDVTVLAPAAMHMVLGERARAAAYGSRGMAVERARELLDDARAYAKRRGDYERNQTRPFSASRMDLEALAPVLERKIPLVVRADKASDVLAAIRLGEEQKVRVVIAGGVEAWKVAAELAAAKVPVILDPTNNLPGSFDELLVRDDAAAVLLAAGVTVAVSTVGDASGVRTLRQLAGVAVSQGLTWDQALAAVTTAPAAIYGGAGGRGALTAGAPADLVVWSGDPFELSTRALHVLIGGVDQSLRTRQTRLLERYR